MFQSDINEIIFCFQKSDTCLLAQFFYADDELNGVAGELDSFDGRKDPERCTQLVSKLRVCQVSYMYLILHTTGK